MGNGIWRNYLGNPREFDGWLKANGVLGSILAIGMLAMALAGLYSTGRPDGAIEAIELSSVSLRIPATLTAPIFR